MYLMSLLNRNHSFTIIQPQKMSIELCNVQKSFGSQLVLNGIDLKIAEGELVAFLGPNGAGKSTTMKIMTGLLDLDCGEVKIAGFDVLTQPMEVRRRIGYLPEHNPLYLDMYVREYLTFVADAYRMKKSVPNRVESVIKRFGLTKEANKKIGQLSKGYRQRVGLAQALINDPKVLILDEPTTGLDPNQLIEIRQIIRELAVDKTVILSTHILQEAAAVCNRIVIIHNGVIVADKPSAELQANFQQEIIEIEFSSSISIKLLKSISSVLNVISITENSYQIISSTDVREQLFHLAVAQGVAILSLVRKEQSLEAIFEGLTK